MVDLEIHDLISRRKEKIFSFVKSRLDWIAYIVLAIIVYIAVWIRTRNLPGLRDITNGGWTLGPDLDPFLFLRYAKYIVEHGSLFAIDTMRYVPLGIPTGDFSLHYYSIAWFHKFAAFFGSTSVEQSASLFPVFMFALTVITFFFLSRKIIAAFYDKNYSNIGALVSTLFFSLIPLFIPRTIAGIPEKESSAFLFMFLAFYLFISAWEAHNSKRRIIFGALAGLSTALMALIWGAYSYIFYIIIPAAFISFLIGNFEKKHISGYAAWIISATVFMVPFSNRYKINTILTSFDRGVALALLAMVVFYHYLYPKIERKISNKKYFEKVPPRLMSTILLGAGLLLIVLVTLGPNFILERFGDIYSNFVNPAPSRLIQTVAENRQPYLVEWIGNFGPSIGGVFITFWLLVVSSIIIFYRSIINFAMKDRFMLTTFFTLMIITVVFSRYSSSSIFNGESLLSLLVYGSGMLTFIIAFLAFYFRVEKNKELGKFETLGMGTLMFLSFFFIALISARGFIRLVMILVPPAAMALGYLASYSSHSLKEKFRDKEKYLQIVVSLGVILLIIFAAYGFFSSSKNLAANYVPSAYNQQWQKAMSWVRENTAPNAVFGHWWDYGYWVQSIGERATVLDGGNSISYWNHLMGRHALTETNLDNTFQFLYAHNVTHFLIDSTDIGKYSAFSTIGSNENYDRRSWIPTFLRDNSQTTERKNQTLFVYPGGSAIDEDIQYSFNGTDVFLPAGKAYTAAIVINVRKDESIAEVLGVYFFNEQTYQIPLRYYWDKKAGGLVDTGKGLEAGVFIYPRVTQNNQGGGEVEPRGAALYLSPRVVKTNLARFYLYGEENKYFREVHSEPDFIVNALAGQNAIDTEFVYFNEFRGPIKIWEVSYPVDTSLNQSWLETDYPDSIRLA